MSTSDIPTDSSFRASVRNKFRTFATRASDATGSAWAFGLSVLIVVLWTVSYPLFMRAPDGFNTWQMIINSLTNIITFLMVFLIQNMQNRDTRAFHLKLDELIRAVHSARNEIVSIEQLPDEEMLRLKKEFEGIRETARADMAPDEGGKAEEKTGGA